MTSQKQPKIAVIGCGYWGKNLVRNLNELGHLSMACDLTEAGRNLAREIAPHVPILSNIDEVIRSSEINALVIATPAVTHFNIALKALEMGKDVFVEKPLSLTYDEGARLVQLAENSDRILMVGHVLEYHPAIIRLRELINTGVLGRIQYIYSNRLSLGKIRREENILWSFAPHDIAIILRLMGSFPIQVAACGGSYVQANIPDVTVTQLLFENGIRAHIHVSWLHPFKEHRLVVIGSKKMATLDDVTKQLVLYDQRVEIKDGQPIPIKGEGEIIEFDRTEPLRLECQAFVDSITHRIPPLTDGTSGLQVLKVLESAQKSLSLNGQPIP